MGCFGKLKTEIVDYLGHDSSGQGNQIFTAGEHERDGINFY